MIKISTLGAAGVLGSEITRQLESLPDSECRSFRWGVGCPLKSESFSYYNPFFLFYGILSIHPSCYPRAREFGDIVI